MGRQRDSDDKIFHLHAPDLAVGEENKELGAYNQKIMDIYARATGAFSEVMLDGGGNFCVNFGPQENSLNNKKN